MSGLDSLIGLSGPWIGHNRLWLPPDEAAHESPTTATVSPIVSGKFIQLAYTWAFDGAAQEGVLLFGHDSAADTVTAVWIDSWHMGDKFMICQGQVEPNGAVAVRGSYAAESGPDWGWRIVVEPEDGAWRMVMYNIMPDGPEMPAVEARYTRGG